MDLSQQTETGASMIAKASPPVAVVSAKLCGITLPDIVQWLTIIYLAILIGHKSWQIFKEWHSGRKSGE
jgi:hypothetical protein